MLVDATSDAYNFLVSGRKLPDNFKLSMPAELGKTNPFNF